MTITEYFAQEQPVSTEIINEIYYKDVQEIVFGENDRYAKIKVAHVDKDTWAFGWEIKDGSYRPAICRECTPSNVTKGNINKLIFGMTKVLQRRLSDFVLPTHLIRGIVRNAILEAARFCKPNKKTNHKITI